MRTLLSKRSSTKTNTVRLISVMWNQPEQSEFIEMESRVAIQGWGGRMRSRCLMGIEFQFCKMEKVHGRPCFAQHSPMRVPTAGYAQRLQ